VISDWVSAREYLDQLSQAPGLWLGEGHAFDYDATVATTWKISFGRLDATPGAVALMTLSAFMASEAIPLDALTTVMTRPGAPGLPQDLTDALAGIAERRQAPPR
jgi:hypothetical protein